MKEKAETLNKKLTELSEDELKQVSGSMRLPDDKPIIDTSSTITT